MCILFLDMLESVEMEIISVYVVGLVAHTAAKIIGVGILHIV